MPRLRRPAPAFLLLAALVGPLYLFALTPFAVPDEPFRYRQALARAAAPAGRAEWDGAFALDGLARFQHRNRPEGYAFLGGAGAPEGTADSAGNIWNLQGRYWTPALPLLLCAAFARDPDPAAPEPAPTGLLFPALALLHLDAVVCIVKTTLGG